MNIVKLIIFLSFLLLNESPVSNRINDRIWLDAELKEKWRLDISDIVYAPARGLKVDGRHQIYIKDSVDNTIKVFDKDGGRFIRTIGEAKGAGPGEIRHLIDFSLDRAGNVWVADPSNARITIFKNDGSFIRHISVGLIPYRIAVEANGEFFYIMLLNSSVEGLFAKFSKEGKLAKQFGTDIIENQARDNMALTGEITTSTTGNMYYSSDFAGLVMGFNPNGEESFKKEAIIPTPLPQVMYDERGGRWVDPGAQRVNSQIYTDSEERFAVLSAASALKQESIWALDFYDQATGQYKNSLRLPEYTFQAHLMEDVLYTLKYTNENIVLFAWQLINS